MDCTVFNLNKEEIGKVELSETIFSVPYRSDIIHRVVKWQLAKRRAGTHNTKLIGEISGSTRKPFKQKGTGNARQGSIRATQMRGGATRGPKPRDYEYNIQKKVRKLALKIALSEKLSSGNLSIIENMDLADGKTKSFRNIVKKFDFNSVLFVDELIADNLKSASSNIHMADVIAAAGLNVYDIVRHNNLVITRSGIKALEERLI